MVKWELVKNLASIGIVRIIVGKRVKRMLRCRVNKHALNRLDEWNKWVYTPTIEYKGGLFELTIRLTIAVTFVDLYLSDKVTFDDLF